jgi:hypothetical protein
MMDAVRLVPAVVRAPLISVGTSSASAVVRLVDESVDLQVMDPERVPPQWIASIVSALKGRRS